MGHNSPGRLACSTQARTAKFFSVSTAVLLTVRRWNSYPTEAQTRSRQTRLPTLSYLSSTFGPASNSFLACLSVSALPLLSSTTSARGPNTDFVGTNPHCTPFSSQFSTFSSSTTKSPFLSSLSSTPIEFWSQLLPRSELLLSLGFRGMWVSCD